MKRKATGKVLRQRAALTASARRSQPKRFQPQMQLTHIAKSSKRKTPLQARQPPTASHYSGCSSDQGIPELAPPIPCNIIHLLAQSKKQRNSIDQVAAAASRQRPECASSPSPAIHFLACSTTAGQAKVQFQTEKQYREPLGLTHRGIPSTVCKLLLCSHKRASATWHSTNPSRQVVEKALFSEDANATKLLNPLRCRANHPRHGKLMHKEMLLHQRAPCRPQPHLMH